MAILAHLREQGLALHAIGEQLVVEPSSALTDPLRESIRAHKADILRELDAETREALRSRVAAKLRDHPELRRTFDVSGAPLKATAAPAVSVVVAVRHGEEILSGELLVPAEKWELAALLGIMDAPEGQQ